MNGHQPLLSLRRAGVNPASISLIDGDCDGRNEWHLYPDSQTGEYRAEVRLSESDVPELLDLRFAVGMTVFVYEWRSLGRGRRLHEAVIAEKAKFVATGVTLGDVYRPSHRELWIYDGKTQKRIEECPSK